MPVISRSGEVIGGLFFGHEQAGVLRPSLKVLFTTGYARNAIIHHGRLDKGVQLISKPFSLQELAAKVRDVMDEPARAGADKPR